MTAGWTVVSSCNSYSVSNSDLWTSSGAIIWNYGNTSYPRSWCLLASPVGFVAGPNGSYLGAQSQMYFCIDANSNDGSQYNNYAWYLNVAWYSTLPTGGTTTTIPTGGNMQALVLSPTSSQAGLIYRTSVTTYIYSLHFAYTSNGGWWASISAAGTAIMCTFMYFLPLVDVSEYNGLPYPYAAIGGYSYNWSQSGLRFSSCFDSAVNPYVKGWNYDGTSGIPRCMSLSSGNTFAGSSTNVTGDFNGKNIVTPAYIYNYVPGKISLIGQIPDFYEWFPITRANGCVFPATSPAYCNIDLLWFSYNDCILFIGKLWLVIIFKYCQHRHQLNLIAVVH